MKIYWRPILSSDPARPTSARLLAGGWLWFDQLERITRGQGSRIVSAQDAPDDVLAALTKPRAAITGVTMDRPRVMSILNVTPDSFSDGGRYLHDQDALRQGRALADICDFIDIGGESTRPGAPEVAVPEEINRTAPVIAALRAAGVKVPISVDTRKAAVARATLEAGADIINDVSAMLFDPAMTAAVVQSGAPVCLMHMRGTPESMKLDTAYEDVLLDVYDALETARDRAIQAGVAPERIMLDPGIGFAKTAEQNLWLVRNLGLFHSLVCPILLGVSRKRFIGTVGGVTEAAARMPGSVAVALAGVAQGAQILRVHDTAETVQALRLWQALHAAT